MEQGVVIMTKKLNFLIEVTVNLGQMWTGQARVLQWRTNCCIAEPLNQKTLKYLTSIFNILNKANDRASFYST